MSTRAYTCIFEGGTAVESLHIPVGATFGWDVGIDLRAPARPYLDGMTREVAPVRDIDGAGSWSSSATR